MPRIIYVDHQGEEQITDAAVGDSVMETAVKNAVPGIAAECGGACACATCHVYVDEAFVDLLPAPDDTELSMLEFALNRTSASRLACQITVSAAIDGLRVKTPERQN